MSPEAPYHSLRTKVMAKVIGASKLIDLKPASIAGRSRPVGKEPLYDLRLEDGTILAAVTAKEFEVVMAPTNA